MECTHKFFFSDAQSQSKCFVAQNICDDYDLVNFFSFLYCWIDAQYWLFIILSIFIIVIVFKTIQLTVEEYLAPSIQFIAQRFQLPDSVCAITLLALVNGAGDLVAAFVASTQKDGLYYNIGAIYGAGLFVCSMVIGLVILIQKETIQINIRTLIRDIGTYILSTLVVISFGIYGELTIYSSITLLTIYVALVFYISIDEYLKKIRGEKTEDLILRQALVNIQLTDFSEFNTVELPSSYNKIYDDSNRSTFITDDPQFTFIDPSVEQKNQRKYCLYMNKVLEIPIQLLLFFSIPNSPHQENLRLRNALFPIPASLLLTVMHTKEIGLTYCIWVLPFVLVLCGVFYMTSENGYQPRYYIILQFLTIYICIGWTFVATDILIDMLQTFGVISNLEKSYLGMTIISVGNALPDAVTTMALAKQGQAALGIIGSYTGQLFGLLVGFGIALLRSNLKGGEMEFDLFSSSDYIIENIIIFSTIFVLLVSLISLINSNGALTKSLGRILVVIYLITFIAISIIAFVKADQTV